MNTTNTSQVAPTTEIVGAVLLNQLDETTLKQFRADPKAALMSNLNLDFGDSLDINCVDNSADTVHLALPYYDSIEAMKAEKISDMGMEEVAGGEIIISIIIGAISGTVVAAAVGGSIGGGAACGAIVGACIGAAAAATAVAVGTGVGLNQRDDAYEAGLSAGRAGDTESTHNGK